MKLTGQKALITGGSSGIGLELARQLYHSGNEVFICGRDASALARVAEELPGIHTFQIDIANEHDLSKFVSTVEQTWGELSLLINNAAIQLLYDFTVVEPATALHNINYEISVNLTALIKLSVLCLPLLQRSSIAAIVNLTSGLGLVPKKSAPVYCATKAGIDIFSKALRYQLEDGANSIRVIEVILPLVDTPMTKDRGTRKLSPVSVAQTILKGVERNRAEVLVGPVPILVLLNRLLPGVAARMMRNS